METPRTTTLELTRTDAPQTQVAYDGVPPENPPETIHATDEYPKGDSDAPRDVVPMDEIKRAETDAQLSGSVDRGEITDPGLTDARVDADFARIAEGFEKTTALPPARAAALGEGVLTAQQWLERSNPDNSPNPAA